MSSDPGRRLRCFLRWLRCVMYCRSLECMYLCQRTDTPTCDIRFSLQGRYAGDQLRQELETFGITNNAVLIHGAAFYAGKDVTEDEFLETDEGEILARLNDYLEKHKLKPGSNDLLVLDIEPRRLAPRHLGNFEDEGPSRKRGMSR